MAPSRVQVVHGALVLLAVALVGKAAHVQLVQGAEWARRAERQHFTADALPAPRGQVLDAAGGTLVESREMVRLRVAPPELSNPKALAIQLGRAGVPREWVLRATDRRRRWVEIPGTWLPTDVAAVVATRGVHAESVMERVLTGTAGIRRIVGRVGPDGRAVDGVELALDTLLTGRRGTVTVLRDARGRRFESPTAPGTAAEPGHTVVLTINSVLQDITERALAEATTKLGASGGDIVVLDPSDGAVLAMASRRPDPRATASTALSEPYEPGSTLKPFIAAALLARGRARPDEVVNTHGGRLELFGRTITDVHRAPSMTLREVIAQSSNVGIVQFAQRLTPREEYETLRDLGFGAPTGVPYPAEAAGTLREPARWSAQSPASLAMGYELAVTPLQLAAAYAAIANDGELLEPALIREIRAPDGTVRFRHRPRRVRQVMPPAVARTVLGMLVETVAHGTAVDADLSHFQMAGKTGTARVAEGRGYGKGRYYASFVGLFPSEDPQFVILVKIDNPSGAYYGGKVAAPISRLVLDAALAARDAALDRGALARRVRERPDTAPAAVARLAALRADTAPTPLAPAPAPAQVPFVVLDLAKSRAATLPASPVVGTPRPVPDVHGRPLREAARLLHGAGFRVQLVPGPLGETVPGAGTPVRAGSVIRLSRGDR